MPQGGRRVDESIEEVTTTTTMTRKRNAIIGEDIRDRGAGGAMMMMRGVGEDTTT